MADQDITPEPRSAQEKFPYTRKFKVLETVMEGSTRTRSLGVCYVPIKLEPCIVLRGKWLRDAGFAMGDDITVTVNEGEIVIKPSQTIAELMAAHVSKS